jgi:hypothetical protein
MSAEELAAQAILNKLASSLLDPFVVKEGTAPDTCKIYFGRTDQQAFHKVALPGKTVSDHLKFVWSEQYKCGVSPYCRFGENTHKHARPVSDIVVEWMLTKLPVLARKLSLRLTVNKEVPGTDASFQSRFPWQGKDMMHEELPGPPEYWTTLVEQHLAAKRAVDSNNKPDAKVGLDLC